MVQDNPWNEVWRSLSLDQTELNIFDIDNLNLSKIEPLWSLMTKGEKLHKNSEKMKDDKRGEL